jgi:hypothetical protein
LLGGSGGNNILTPTIQKLEKKCDKLVKVESILSPDSSENDSRNINNKEMSEDERQRKFYNDSLEDEIDNNEHSDEEDDDDDDEFDDNKSNLSIDDTCSIKSKGYYDWNKITSNEWQKSYMGKSELDTSNTKTNNGSKKKAIPGLYLVLKSIVYINNQI